MKQKFYLLVLICFFSGAFKGKTQSKKELKLFKEIYHATINYHFRSKTKPFYFVMPNETINKELPKITFEQYEYKSTDVISDSSWIRFFRKADEKRKKLVNYTIPIIDSLDRMAVRLTTKDSLDSVMKNGGFWGTFQKTYGSAKGYIELSSVIISNDNRKAIVELNHYGGNDTGVGMLYLLQKDKKGNWNIVGGFNLWVA